MKYLFSVLSLAAVSQALKSDSMKLYEVERSDLITVGILTLPTSAQNLPLMSGRGHYITEMNDIFLRAGGLSPVAIPFNATDDHLYDLLG